jgi:hypothetical protein
MPQVMISGELTVFLDWFNHFNVLVKLKKLMQ